MTGTFSHVFDSPDGSGAWVFTDGEHVVRLEGRDASVISLLLSGHGYTGTEKLAGIFTREGE